MVVRLYKAQALIFFEQLQIPSALFEASNGWLEGLKRRKDIHYRASSERTDTINIQEAYLQLDPILKSNDILKYSTHNIFNLDKTALFWRTTAKKD